MAVGSAFGGRQAVQAPGFYACGEDGWWLFEDGARPAGIAAAAFGRRTFVWGF